MKSFILAAFLIFASYSISQESSFSSLESLENLMSSKATKADSIIKSKGFLDSEVNGLMIIYLKNNERLSFQSNPREVTLQSVFKDTYLKISNQVADNYTLLNNNDTIVVNTKSYKASTFENGMYKISFWTEYNSTKKTNIYLIRILKNPAITNSPPAKKETEKQTVTIPEKVKLGIVTKPIKRADTDSLNLKKSNTSLVYDGIPCKKINLTGGFGFYRYLHIPGPGWNGTINNTSEGLIAWNFGLEISKTDSMIKRGKNYINTKIDINATSFLGMQRYYADGITSGYQTMYLTKSYLTIGLISEIRRKKESLLFNFCPGLNWTTGKIESVGREGFVTPSAQIGEYYQHNFISKKTNKEKVFMRFGFEQFFSMKGGYMGQFVVTLGF